MSEESNCSRNLSSGDSPRSSWPPASDRAVDDGGAHERHIDGPQTTRFVVLGSRGLHVRAAARLVLAVSRYSCAVTVRHGDLAANAKSVMEILLLRASSGATVEVVAVGEDARACLNEIEQLASTRFGDPS